MVKQVIPSKYIVAITKKEPHETINPLFLISTRVSAVILMICHASQGQNNRSQYGCLLKRKAPKNVAGLQFHICSTFGVLVLSFIVKNQSPRGHDSTIEHSLFSTDVETQTCGSAILPVYPAACSL